LAGLRYLKPGLAAVLVFVGTKMLLVDVYKIPPLVSLGVIVTILTVAFVASSLVRRGHDEDGTGVGADGRLAEARPMP
jgi:tellurite resistance protein TerC